MPGIFANKGLNIRQGSALRDDPRRRRPAPEFDGGGRAVLPPALSLAADCATWLKLFDKPQEASHGFGGAR
jgi:hypothetical protein